MKRETYLTCLDPAIKILQPHPLVFDSNIKELKFWKMFCWGLAYWEESEYDRHLHNAIIMMVSELSKINQVVEANFEGEDCKCGNDHTYKCIYKRLGKLNPAVMERIQQLKPQAKEICVGLLGGAVKWNSFKKCNEDFLQRDVPSFIDLILHNFKYLLSTSTDMTAPMNQQIAFMQQKLKECRRLANCTHHAIARLKKFSEVMCHTQTWVKRISCLAFFYWIGGQDEHLAPSMECMVSDTEPMGIPHTPGIVASYLEDTTIPQLLGCYIDFLLEGLVMHVKDVEILYEGLIFLASFIVDPPEEDSEDKELILTLICSIIDDLQRFVCSIHLDNMEGISAVDCSDFLPKITEVKNQVRELYAITPLPSQSDSPKTNVIGFLDSLLTALKKMYEAKVHLIPSIKHQVEIVRKELELLRPLVGSNIWVQNEHEEFENLWNKTIDAVYFVAYVTKFCSAKSFSLWFGIVTLPQAAKDIRITRAEFQKIEGHELYKDRRVFAEMESSFAVPARATTSKMEEIFVGFKEDARTILDYLTQGRDTLTIISISGLPGQGKTTLTKRIYNDIKIQYHFKKLVWCYVSKDCGALELLIKIGYDMFGPDSDISMLEFSELADRLRKTLKKQRYLIVMDDIWDVAIWKQVKLSFPNDNNGSRIIFTSRNHDLASQTGFTFNSHPLRLFSEEESWELMNKKLFSGCSPAPTEFSKVAQEIASYCKGLPLAVVLIASLLQREERKLDWWTKVAENLKLHLVNEGCRDIIELSYEYLPDHLKLCYLYFGAFPRGEEVSANKLKRLWIAEGFVNDNGVQHAKDLAKEYLDNLVSQSLVVVTKRSSMSGIKTCNIHDLLYDLCMEKGVTENFLNWLDSSNLTNQIMSSAKYCHHRLCIGRIDPFIKPNPIISRKELQTSKVHSLLWFSESGYKVHSPGFLKRFKVLTVLDLCGVYLKCDGFPESVLSMIHLRYLALDLFDQLDGIQPSIANLWNLETLIIALRDIIRDPLPVSLWKMKSLRHVEISGGARLDLEDLDGDDSIATHNLETLGSLHLAFDHKTMEFFSKLTSLRKMDCCLEEENNHPMWFSMLGSLTKLESLKMKGWWNLQLDEMATTFNFPRIESLKKLTLSQLRLPSSSISAIGKQLPNLEVLKLDRDSFLGPVWNVEDESFSKLKYLKLQGLHIEEIDVSDCEDPFPSLEELVVQECYSLMEIPSSFGGLYVLKTITIKGCPYRVNESAMQILEQQQDDGNCDFQVFVINGNDEDNFDDEDHEDGHEEEMDQDDDQEEAGETDDEEDTKVENGLRKRKWPWKN
ncbi:OLC1v1021937C1 [Oldenlandia corymbosa var. corymbosa]|uniref:OLC1v1021937C1 n=1 Tax=Oldenlandia corymbosa var. corymbosa TaxID=529605 RepID=A0AAV1BY26_OLDCO|nr:OLC1v1021937C1 [Oldenlandia corymbosa var. corymbosa]